MENHLDEVNQKLEVNLQNMIELCEEDLKQSMQNLPLKEETLASERACGLEK